MSLNKPIRILKVLFPFLLILGLTLIVGISGLVLHEIDRFSSLAWGSVEMVHVALGLVLTLGLLGYLVHHLVIHWGEFSDIRRILGLALSADLVVAVLTGLLFELRGDSEWGSWLTWTHYISTFPILPLLIAHTLGPLRRWLGGGKAKEGTS
ncbi:MAG: hypothetical protein VX498_03475 [Myxococcota bacterium]|nr:hypothetical protein [Myxococcota bacterium]